MKYYQVQGLGALQGHVQNTLDKVQVLLLGGQTHFEVVQLEEQVLVVGYAVMYNKYIINIAYNIINCYV